MASLVAVKKEEESKVRPSCMLIHIDELHKLEVGVW